jgi:hypothetical protein
VSGYWRWLLPVGVLAAAAVASAAVAAPPADGYTRHTAIPASLGTTTFDSTNAPKSKNSCGSNDGDGHFVYFKWDATESATITADTQGSAYDTVMIVYLNGKQIGCNDDTNTSGTCGGSATHCSVVTFDSVEGRTYYFAVGAYDGDDGGDTHLNLSD